MQEILPKGRSSTEYFWNRPKKCRDNTNIATIHPRSFRCIWWFYGRWQVMIFNNFYFILSKMCMYSNTNYWYHFLSFLRNSRNIIAVVVVWCSDIELNLHLKFLELFFVGGMIIILVNCIVETVGIMNFFFKIFLSNTIFILLYL